MRFINKIIDKKNQTNKVDGTLSISSNMLNEVNQENVELSRLKSTFKTTKKENLSFRVPTDTDLDREEPNNDIDISHISNWEELLDELFTKNSLAQNKKRNIASIQQFLQSKDKTNFMRNVPQNMKVDYLTVCKGSFDDGGIGKQISGVERKYTREELLTRGKHDFRITIKNSNDITTIEALSFIKELVSESNKRGINLRAKNYWESDAIILYLDKEELYNTVKLLEDLKDVNKYGENVSNAIEHFGPLQPFSASLSPNSYYGISMAHSEPALGENSNLISMTFGAAKDTFNGYIEKALNQIYTKLLNKYGEVNKITAEEMYNELVCYHQMYMLGETNSDIPLWMNRRNYYEYIETREKRKNEHR